MQIKTPTSRRRAMKPSLEARTVNQVGRPWMLLEDMLPDPLAVATWIEKSLTTPAPPARSSAFSSRTVLTHGLLFLSSGLSRRNGASYQTAASLLAAGDPA